MSAHSGWRARSFRSIGFPPRLDTAVCVACRVRCFEECAGQPGAEAQVETVAVAR